MAKKAANDSVKETARKKGSPKNGAAPKGKASAEGASSKAGTLSQVTIRMYQQGLGDCFLITFANEDKSQTRVLIDCGVFLNTPGEAERMKAVAKSLKEETGGNIDLLIVTHEHWDHISGFSHANDLFKTFEFKEVWLSWAENLHDPDARAVQATLGKSKAQLTAALGLAKKTLGLTAASDQSQLPEDLQTTESMLGFLGPLKSVGLGAARPPSSGPRMDLDTTMNWIRDKVREKDYCSPGEVRGVPGATGVRAFILGPPRDVSLLRHMNPTGDEGYKLKLDQSLASQLSFQSAVDRETALDEAKKKMPAGPFDDQYRVELNEAAHDPFFRRHYGFTNDPLADPIAVWRRIDNDWLVGGISRLALQLDVGVNNTSLALAFELPGGQTLIFPGDAQMGNWESWGSLVFKVTDSSGKDKDVTAKDILNRAVFYKVGHHGSHNATMKAGGLEEMTSGNLVAMIPTDENYAHTKRPPKTGWEMPAHGVYDALRHFTRERIIRADDFSTNDVSQRLHDPSIGKSRSWTDFISSVKFGGVFPEEAGEERPKTLYVEFVIELPPS